MKDSKGKGRQNATTAKPLIPRQGANEPYNSIFQRDWWLDTVAPGQWQSFEVTQGGKIVARMPIVQRRRAGVRLLKMPRLTQTLGPWVATPEGSLPTRLAKEEEWLSELASKIPQFDYFCQNWHYSVQNWLPFLWRGFQSSLSTTYILPDLTDLEAVWRNYRGATRTAVRKAQQAIVVDSGNDADSLYEMTSMSFGQWGRTPPYSREYLTRLVDACYERDAGKVFTAKDEQGNLHAALLLVWDRNTAYYLVSGSAPALRASCAMSLLMHEAICFASGVSRTFDFEGSVVKPIERFVRSFGAEPRPFITLRGYSRKLQIAQGFRDMFRQTAA
ncbi:hypothetical protein MalM25_26440 [Planctomycetes bacterium MalM25]|nr:hypothetical protein MalM25_26440 [Planctomycetes bacterium MalM25]